MQTRIFKSETPSYWGNFQPTMELRWLLTCREVYHEDGPSRRDVKVLQQKWINKLGDIEWKDIPVVSD